MYYQLLCALYRIAKRAAGGGTLAATKGGRPAGGSTFFSEQELVAMEVEIRHSDSALSSLNDNTFFVFIVRKLQERARRAGMNPNSVLPPTAKVLRKLFARLVPEIVNNIRTLNRRRILV